MIEPCEISINDWLEAEKSLQPERPKGSITIAEFAAKAGVPRTTAQNRLERLVAANKAVKHRIKGPGRSCVYVLQAG